LGDFGFARVEWDAVGGEDAGEEFGLDRLATAGAAGAEACIEG
jgi:hypothetical protein